MSRARRTHAPGCAFHLTARTQNGALWFNERLCESITEYVCEAAASSTTRLLSFAVMPNHIHMIGRQGSQPLGWMVQRVLQRTALLVRRTYNHKGHVFGQRYWSGLCDDARYLRQAIIYTHLNPYHAGLCSDPAEYKWTSHGAYMGLASAAPWSMHVSADHGLNLFASTSTDTVGLRSDYMRFIRYWMRRPKLPLGAKYLFTEEEIEHAPTAGLGDRFWSSEYDDAVSTIAYLAPTHGDVHDRAQTALRLLAPDLTLNQVRMAGRQKAMSNIRRQLVAMLLISGHGNGAIARCINVSTGHVSDIAAAIRRGKPEWNFETRAC